MKVFKLYSDEYFYGISGETEQQARETLDDFASGISIIKTEEIPSEKWDEEFIEMYEDNDLESEAFFVSINHLISKEYGEILFSNDPDYSS